MIRFRFLPFLSVFFLLAACGPEPTPVAIYSGVPQINTSVPSRLASYRVSSVALDGKDLAWVGTDGALASFDGTNLRLFTAREGGLASNHILCVFSDHANTVWIGTDKGLFTYGRYNQFDSYPDQYGRPVPAGQVTETSDGVLVVNAGSDFYGLGEDRTLIPLSALSLPDGTEARMVPDDDGGLWVLTRIASVHFNRSFEEIGRFAAGSPAGGSLCAVRDTRGRLWVLQGRELTCFDLLSGMPDYVCTLPEEYPVDFLHYEEPQLLLKSSRYGLQAFDPANRRFVEPNLPYIPETPSRADISCLSTDRRGNLWIGYAHNGVVCVSALQRRLELLNGGALYRATRGAYIGSLGRTADGKLWGSSGQRLFRYDPGRDAVDFFDAGLLPGEDRQAPRVVTDGQDGLWLIGEERIGVGTASAGRPGVRRSRRLGFRPGRAVAVDGTCYFTADTPYLYAYDRNGRLDSLRIDAVTAPFYDRDAHLLPVGRNDLLVLCSGLACTLIPRSLEKSEPMRVYNESVARDEKVVDAVLDGRTVWLSLGSGGLYSLDLGEGSITSDPALAGLGISGLTRYADGRLLFGSGSGIFYYDLKDRSMRNLSLRLDGNNVTSFTPGGAVRGVNSVILGSNDGCVTVPADIPMQAEDHYVSVQWMQARGKDGTETIRLPVGEESAVLDHRHNSVEIHFGAVSYDGQPVWLEYFMEGYNDGWVSAGRERTAYYPRLSAGKYTFRVREVQPFAGTTVGERAMQLTVKPSPWRTLPAYFLYILLGAGLVWLLVYSWFKVRSDEMRLSVVEQQHELERRTNRMNMSFFANIAHEFRNPLTIISGPLASLLRDSSLSDPARRKVTAISESANSMLRLIDQMLDFNQIEMDVLKMCVGERDVPFELSRMVEIFEQSAEPRGIRIETAGLEDPFVATVDMDKIDKIVSNLFTNALKHTPDSGVIGLSFDTASQEEVRAAYPGEDLPDGSFFKVCVTNNGRTIPEDKLPNVFLRYYQSSETSADHDYGWGRGIGLYYVKQLVHIHGGAIRVDNLPEGVAFSFVIPTDKAFYEGVERENENVHRILQIDVPKEKKPAPDRVPEGQETSPTLLLVDDDIQIGSYLRSLFEDDFLVVNKYSAEAALSEMEKINPDLIISDVVMGRMSGYDFCRSVKSNLMYSHIPFILLTAKSDVEDSVSGLESGANAYVSKPFSAEYLTALVNSLLRNVRQLRSFLNAHTGDELTEEGAMSEQDKNFMRDLYALMDKCLSDADLNVASVCEELRISRSKFNYKLKGLTGSSPGTFFRHFKLNRAAKLLREGKYNVSEVADMIGFSSISNFSASFKKMFGVAPRDYQ